MDGEALKPEAFLSTGAGTATLVAPATRSPPHYPKVNEATVSLLDYKLSNFVFVLLVFKI